jgi:hypothetical protein
MPYTNPIRQMAYSGPTADLTVYRSMAGGYAVREFSRSSVPGLGGKRKNEAIYQKREMDGVIYRLVKSSLFSRLI